MSHRHFDDLEHDDGGSFGTSRATLEHWDRTHLDALEFLHKHKDLRSRKPNREEVVHDVELARGLYEATYGLRIVPQKPHEYAFALILRPFSRPALNGEIPWLASSLLTPGYCFIGLERNGEPAVPSNGVTSHCINSVADLENAPKIAAAARTTGFVFFQAADEMWKDVVLKFAGFSSAIVIDLSESTKGLEWELETLLPQYGDRIVCYAIDAEASPSGPWKDRVPADLKITPVLTHTGATVASRLFPDLLPRRVSHDDAIVRNFIERAIKPLAWGDDFVAGLVALKARDLDGASRCLVSAWDCATRLTPHQLMLVYPGLVLADTLTLTGDREKRRSVLARTVGLPSTPVAGTEFEQRKADMELIRRLLSFSHADLPVAVWQFCVVLLGGLSLELSMMHHYGVALGWQQNMGMPKAGAATEMFLWHADEAVRVARRLKDSYMEMTALEFSALAHGAFGDRRRAAERAQAGADVAMRRGDTTMTRKLSRLAGGLT